jgi:hypothetical protein
METCPTCGAGVVFRFNAFTGGYSYFCLRVGDHIFPSTATASIPVVVPK